MTKRKIAILGGGMAGLSAAYQLSRTEELRAQYDVTVYQMGWRLGGKGASGRDALGRNLEHGLHVWFGFYENTFKLIQEVYAARPPIEGGWALPTWQDAVKPQAFTPIGVESSQGEWSFWPVTWPTNDAVPGSGGLFPSLFEMLVTMTGWVRLIVTGHEGPGHGDHIANAGEPPARIAHDPNPLSALSAVEELIGELAKLERASMRASLDETVHLLEWAHHALFGRSGAKSANRSIPHDLFNIFKASAKGIIEDLLLKDAPFLSLDDVEFRAWLISHGADPDVVANSTITRLIYDTAYQYVDGDASRPDLAAGTALGTIMRIVLTYKGTCIWEVQAGMGEVIVGPLYEHLVANGVHFEFFNKVSSLQLEEKQVGAKAPVIGAVEIDVQAQTIAEPYRPVKRQDGMVIWPSAPHWEQLVGGADLKQAKVNFESHWNAHPPVETRTLRRGEDFDDVVLAIALGALKTFNPGERGICEELTQCNAPFANWVQNTPIVPSLNVQLWCGQTTEQLGWKRAKPACVSGPEYLDIWADMTQVLAFEPWQEPKPQSLHYLTGTFPTTLYRAPRSASETPAKALSDLRAETVTWLNTLSYAAWPNAQSDGHFDWSVLAAPDGVEGEARLSHQYLRINIDPTECTTLSGAGLTQYRLHAETDFPNLFLAGEGTAMGLVTSFEGAIMSGSAAARAICGEPAEIIGYDFLERRPSQGFG